MSSPIHLLHTSFHPGVCFSKDLKWHASCACFDSLYGLYHRYARFQRFSSVKKQASNEKNNSKLGVGQIKCRPLKGAVDLTLKKWSLLLWASFWIEGRQQPLLILKETAALPVLEVSGSLKLARSHTAGLQIDSSHSNFQHYLSEELILYRKSKGCYLTQPKGENNQLREIHWLLTRFSKGLIMGLPLLPPGACATTTPAHPPQPLPSGLSGDG